MQIAPGFDSADWKALKLDDPDSPDWAKAVEILETRISGRFIEPVDCLIAADESKPPAQRRFGFAVLAIDCLLVETLEAFRLGLKDTGRESRKTFCHFLTERPLFKVHFTKEQAELFYKHFRCGILHQAEVGSGSKVWSVGPLIQSDGATLTINRTKFHGRLKADFQSYLAELRDPANAQLRKHFRTKMDFVCRH
ncbi:MAG: hypothetical protein WD847_11595 [Pirellulales bacterium]